MPDHASLHEALDQLASDAAALQQRLRRTPVDGTQVLTARITEAQALAANALRLFLDLERETPRDQAHLRRLDHLARTAKTAQDASAELTAALARAVENERRRQDAATSPPVLLRPTPQQFVTSAADLLDGLLSPPPEQPRPTDAPVPPAR
ncbi:hypothetical protein ACGF7W_18575 [Streptomyces sp. NPDC048219]|uniref:Uncharacterized protein n=1 Tax=Streptomyces coelicoflavus TaxID=285562 RepID=A0A7K3PK53_9ACTN|nr:hypothetical protein [Streptomyces coelicoflavus]NEB09761.1 hypothetical protein [Streptomyces coelicoflavus]